MNKKKFKKGFTLGNECKKSWVYLKESRNFIYASVVIFLIFGLIGFIFPIPTYLLEKINELFLDLIEKTKDMSQIELTWFIFLNNLRVGFLSIVLGIFLGILPLFEAIFNGYLIGFVFKLSVIQGEIGSLWKLLPHGIFELPAIFISMGLGLKLGISLVYEFFKKYFKDFSNILLWILIFFIMAMSLITFIPLLIILIFFFIFDVDFREIIKNSLKYNFSNSLRVFLLIIIPLLIIAAIIEGWFIIFLK